MPYPRIRGWSITPGTRRAWKCDVRIRTGAWAVAGSGHERAADARAREKITAIERPSQLAIMPGTSLAGILIKGTFIRLRKHARFS